MAFTCGASPNRVRLNTPAVISVGGIATYPNGKPASDKKVTVKADWGETRTAGVNPQSGAWGVTLINMPNSVGTWAIHCECPGVGYRATAAKRIR